MSLMTTPSYEPMTAPLPSLHCLLSINNSRRLTIWSQACQQEWSFVPRQNCNRFFSHLHASRRAPAWSEPSGASAASVQVACRRSVAAQGIAACLRRRWRAPYSDLYHPADFVFSRLWLSRVLQRQRASAALLGAKCCILSCQRCLAPGGSRRRSHATTRPGPAGVNTCESQ